MRSLAISNTIFLCDVWFAIRLEIERFWSVGYVVIFACGAGLFFFRGAVINFLLTYYTDEQIIRWLYVENRASSSEYLIPDNYNFSHLLCSSSLAEIFNQLTSKIIKLTGHLPWNSNSIIPASKIVLYLFISINHIS